MIKYCINDEFVIHYLSLNKTWLISIVPQPIKIIAVVVVIDITVHIVVANVVVVIINGLRNLTLKYQVTNR